MFCDSVQGIHAPEFSQDGEGTSRNKLVKWIFSDTATISGAKNEAGVCTVTQMSNGTVAWPMVSVDCLLFNVMIC